MKMSILSLTVPRFLLKNPHKSYNRVAPGLKGHNTGKGLIALSPLLLPVFVSDIFPGSKSGEEIVKDSGILSLAQVGDRWLADKGFMVQHILDGYGVIVETPEKLSKKKQFTEEQDMHNRKNSQVRVHVERAI